MKISARIKKILAFYTAIALCAVVLFGFADVSDRSAHCVAARASNTLCPISPLAAAVYHVSAYQTFMAVFLKQVFIGVFLAAVILFVFLVIFTVLEGCRNIFPFAQPPPSPAGRRDSPFAAVARFIYWLSLFELSPSVLLM